ncbi:MAG: hypothetical protein AAB606_04040 [Patescibacteria group bacterium]
MSLYTYTTGDLLEKPNTYFYAEYHGLDFLEAWKRERAEVFGKLGVQLPAVPGKPGLLQNLCAKMLAGEILDTHFIFDAVKGALSSGESQKETEFKNILNKLVQKFEVSKRWYSKYDASMKAADKTAYHDLELYVRGAEIFESAFAAFGDLPYLNALLKSIDTLCSVCEKLDAGQRGRLARMISSESDCINSIK